MKMSLERGVDRRWVRSRGRGKGHPEEREAFFLCCLCTATVVFKDLHQTGLVLELGTEPPSWALGSRNPGMAGCPLASTKTLARKVQV